jgi:hypothetical protein
MHPEIMQALAAQRGSELQTDADAARRARQARRTQLTEQYGQFSARESTGAALSTSFRQTLGVISNADAAVRTTPGRSPLRGSRHWTNRLTGLRSVESSPTGPKQPATCAPSN